MRSARYGHRAEAISANELIVMGGNGEAATLGVCEEYSIIDNEWREMPALNKPRYWHASAFINERLLYVIGGCNTDKEIEVLDISEKKAWIFVPILTNELKYDNSMVAFPISKTEIMILCGNGSCEAGIFNIKENTIKVCENTLRPDNYYYNPASVSYTHLTLPTICSV
eukprot:TRINITY_DN6020_c0_g2_i4.p2 TRINITY_DN6020_c0_g2~~TRINITY_DN6020_c0_g2_i4.p2  ORF type:complete len:169 (+),score=31.44 TRINITY_DN6020_c0_g2_i4:401-907(+)